MFYSQCLLSSKGPLGAVWVAAYCHKRLKRNQVTQTDISFSVDKILLDGVPVITYRVLGYLLLGVVRIYSKKVEYLFDDCHNVLMKVKDLLVSKKFNAHRDTLSAPYHSITLPDRFELDAFEFEVLEDVSGGNVMPREAIMLKDPWINVGIGNYSLEEYHCEGVAAHFKTCSNADTLDEDILPHHLMDIDMVVSPSHNLSNSEASMEKLRENRSFQEKGLGFEMFNWAEEESPDLVIPIGEGHQTGKEQIKVPKLTSLENAKCQVITEDHNLRNLEASIEKLGDNMFSQTIGFSSLEKLERFGGAEAEPPDLVRPFGEEHDTNAEQIKFLEMTSSEKQKWEEPPDLVRPFGEKHDTDAEQIKFPEMTSSENRKHHLITEDHPSSIIIYATPESKFPEASGATTPDFMVISTPANKERARTPSKRKCFFDNDVVLSNKVVRESIHDSSGLVCKRRKAPRTPLDAWKACRILNFSQGFLEPLIPCTSLELRSLFCNKKSKISEPVETVETPEKLDLPGSPTVGRSSVDLPGSPTVERSSEQISGSTEQTGRSSEQTAIAPETPVQCSTSMGLFEGPEITNLDRVTSVSALEAVEEGPSLSENQELDLNLMNEETNSSEGDSQELHGWSVRTRTVARFLRRSFLNRKKRREEEIMSLLQVLKGRTKKESARLFYEILVLKSKGVVDVKQDNTYGDILFWKLPRWEQFCELDGL